MRGGFCTRCRTERVLTAVETGGVVHSGQFCRSCWATILRALGAPETVSRVDFGTQTRIDAAGRVRWAA